MMLPNLFLYEIRVLPENARLGRWFAERGVRVEWCSRGVLPTGRFPVAPDTLVAGSVEFVHEALTLLGCRIPHPLGFPAEVVPFLGRDVVLTDVATARSFAASRTVFVKPAATLKLFDAGLSSSPEVADVLERLAGDIPVFVADPVVFVAEWRCFVLNGSVVAVEQYVPDIDVELFPAPNGSFVEQLAAIAYDVFGSAAFSVDVGLLDTGELVLVEFNDGYALGSYGIADELYGAFLSARWEQLMNDLR